MQRALTQWIRKRGYSLVIEPGAAAEVDFEGPKRVRLNSRVDKGNRTSAALHECGHILIFEARCKQRKSAKAFARPIAGSNLRDYTTNKRRLGTNTCKRKVAILT
jgi:hypothetical protein